jgi:hypothetical protein
LPPPPSSVPTPTAPSATPAPKPKAPRKAATTPKKTEPTTGDQVKDIATGFAKDMLTTADGRRTLRSVFGTLFGKK